MPFWLCCWFIDFCRQKLSSDLDVKVKNLRLEFSELHLKHKSLSSEFQIQRDIDAKYKADLERLKGKFALLCSYAFYPHCELLRLEVTMKIVFCACKVRRSL